MMLTTWSQILSNCSQYISDLIFNKPCEIDGRFILTTYREKRILRVQWSPDRWRRMSPKGQGDPKIFQAQYLNNRVRYIVGS